MKRILLSLLLLLVLAVPAQAAGTLLVTDDLGPVGPSNPLPTRNGIKGYMYDAFVPAEFAADATTNPALDFFTITGSNQVTVYVYEMDITLTAGTSAPRMLQVARRKTANSGGTSSTVTSVARDRRSPDAAATVRSYTDVQASTSFVAGTLVGYVWSQHVQQLATNTTGGAQPYTAVVFDPPLVLRGANELLAFNFSAGAAAAGNKVLAGVKFSEVRSQ